MPTKRGFALNDEFRCHEATLFTDDMAKLAPQLGVDVSKTSALEINQGSSIARGIGLGL
jgi:hypothetical protein